MLAKKEGERKEDRREVLSTRRIKERGAARPHLLM